LTRALAKIKEEEGNKKDAAELLQEVQIETIGTMEAAEKIDFILESIRLCLDIGDYVRAFLISKKVTTKSLLDIKHQDLKIRFYTLMIKYWNSKKSYLDIYRCYQAIYDTPKIQESNEWPPILQNMILFVILSPYDNHQHDAMNRAFTDKRIEDRSMIMYRELLRLFVSSDLIDWPEFQQRFRNDLSKTQVFTEDPSRWDELHDRIIEHNIRTIAKYYSKIHTKRLASLLHLEEQKAEDFVSKMVINKTISAKIDRIEGIVAFTRPKETTEVLNNWSQDTEKLLSYVEKSVHLINKELAQSKKK
jgi:26S proteasome regulatory subunit N5